jgi:hypothetical protein
LGVRPYLQVHSGWQVGPVSLEYTYKISGHPLSLGYYYPYLVYWGLLTTPVFKRAKITKANKVPPPIDFQAEAMTISMTNDGKAAVLDIVATDPNRATTVSLPRSALEAFLKRGELAKFPLR